MGMRVNHNIAGMTALRNLSATERNAQKNLERLSSGMKINTAADGPAQLMVSERMRAQIKGLEQAIRNSETSITMMQTTEGALSEVSSILLSLRQLSIHAANEGANDSQMLAADQSEVENLMASLDRISRNTQFGTKTLLDGSNAANGIAVGEGMLFVEATPQTTASPTNGFPINITQVATQNEVTATAKIDMNNAQETTFVLSEGGRVVKLDTEESLLGKAVDKLLITHKNHPEGFTEEMANEAVREIIAQNFQKKADESGLRVNVFINQAGMLTVQHKNYGSKYNFSATSSKDGLLSVKANTAMTSSGGGDIAGTIGGQVALGDGQELSGAPGTKVEGLTVAFTKVLGTKVMETVDPDTGVVTRTEIPQTNTDLVGSDIDGFVHVSQNSLVYQVGANEGQTVKISLSNMSARALARGLANESEFKSLADIDVTHAQGAQDGLRLIDKAIEQVTNKRGEIGSFQKNALESNLNSLTVATENLTNAESVIRDTDMAAEMSDFTKNQILLASGTAMSAQANQIPKSVLQLLSGAN